MPQDLSQTVASFDVAGCAVGLLRRGEEPEFVFHGECVDGGEAVTSGVLWEAASLGKPVVALLAAAHVANNPALLSRPILSDPSAFGAAEDGRWREVNLLHLLTHSSGLPNWRAEGQPLRFESDPGTAGYSGEGYELLLSELSRQSTLGAGLLLHQHLERLQMGSSTFTPDLAAASVVAIGHDESGAPVPKQHWGSPKAASSLHTTVHDYLQFLRAVARPDDVENTRLRDAARLIAERRTEVLPGHGRTLGWAFAEGEAGDVLWQHGDNPGFKHVAAVRPSMGEAIVVFTNDDNGQPLYRNLCRDFLGVEVW